MTEVITGQILDDTDLMIRPLNEFEQVYYGFPRVAFARYLIWRGNSDEANLHLDAILAEDETHVAALKTKADIAYGEGNTDQALGLYHQTIDSAKRYGFDWNLNDLFMPRTGSCVKKTMILSNQREAYKQIAKIERENGNIVQANIARENALRLTLVTAYAAPFITLR